MAQVHQRRDMPVYVPKDILNAFPLTRTPQTPCFVTPVRKLTAVETTPPTEQVAGAAEADGARPTERGEEEEEAAPRHKRTRWIVKSKADHMRDLVARRTRNREEEQSRLDRRVGWLMDAYERAYREHILLGATDYSNSTHLFHFIIPDMMIPPEDKWWDKDSLDVRAYSIFKDAIRANKHKAEKCGLGIYILDSADTPA